MVHEEHSAVCYFVNRLQDNVNGVRQSKISSKKALAEMIEAFLV